MASKMSLLGTLRAGLLRVKRSNRTLSRSLDRAVFGGNLPFSLIPSGRAGGMCCTAASLFPAMREVPFTDENAGSWLAIPQERSASKAQYYCRFDREYPQIAGGVVAELLGKEIQPRSRHPRQRGAVHRDKTPLR